jgi:predicted metal-dependent TIM-barrel fold hydrolase
MREFISKLTIQEKFKIVEATQIYPAFGREDINIDNDWCERLSELYSVAEIKDILCNRTIIWR